MINVKDKKEKADRRHRRVRAKVSGTSQRPRLYIFCSNKHIYAQLIDDQAGKTIFVAKDSEVKTKLTGKRAIAFEVGKLIAQKAIKNNIKKVVFDRGTRLYHGKVKALAEGARNGGLEF